jgi:hypothetical protein
LDILQPEIITGRLQLPAAPGHRACWSAVLTGTKRIVGPTAPQIASASAAPPGTRQGGMPKIPRARQIQCLMRHGVSLAPNKGDGNVAVQNCQNSTSIPETAKEAATQAVCIMDIINNREYDTKRASFEDTLGYILLQIGDVNGAASALNNTEGLLDKSGLFRYSIVEHASGEKVHDEVVEKKAIKDLDRSLEDNDYFPSHELSRLKSYITGRFKEELDKQINVRLVPNRNLPPCRQ